MPRLRIRALGAIASPLVLSSIACAADPPMVTLEPSSASVAQAAPPPPGSEAVFSPEPKWTIQIEPSMWYVSPSGKVKLPVGSGTGPGSFTTAGDSVEIARLNLDSPRFEPAGEVHLSADKWRFSFSGCTYGINRDTIADSSFRLGSVMVAPGDPLKVDFSMTSVEVTAGYCIWGRVFSAPSFTQHSVNAVDSLARIYVIGGGRFYNASFDVRRDTATPASADTDEFFGEPIVGFRGELELAENFTIDLQFSGGGLPAGDKTSYSFDVSVGFQWRPIPNLGIQIGYRQLAYDLSDGKDAQEFEYNGRLAGLFTGIVLRF